MNPKAGRIRTGFLPRSDQIDDLLLLLRRQFRSLAADAARRSGLIQAYSDPFAQHGPFELGK